MSDEKCPLCQKEMVERNGSRGPFLGCSGYPTCKHTRDIKKDDRGDKKTDSKIASESLLVKKVIELCVEVKNLCRFVIDTTKKDDIPY